MADYFTYFSFTIPLTAEQQDWATNELYRMNDDDDDRYPHVICEGSGSAPATGHDIVLTSDGVRSAKMEGEYLWIHPTGCGFLKAVEFGCKPPWSWVFCRRQRIG